MNQNILPQSIIEVTDALSSLPGIGPKTAAKLAIYLVTNSDSLGWKLEKTLGEAREKIKLCESCHNLAEGDQCNICSDADRDNKLLLIVESPTDLMQVEEADIFKGYYWVLNGLISPVNGVSPQDLDLYGLEEQVRVRQVEEIVFALSSTVEGESTTLYVEEYLRDKFPDLKVTRLARGLPTGVNIEYLDKETIKGALSGRY